MTTPVQADPATDAKLLRLARMGAGLVTVLLVTSLISYAVAVLLWWRGNNIGALLCASAAFMIFRYGRRRALYLVAAGARWRPEYQYAGGQLTERLARGNHDQVLQELLEITTTPD